ncbi:MAG: radical SAM protein [Deltaproteobacteria bacterium]|nr:radical SAM protein [Deltaproteobacteria bacterium]
MSTHPTGHVYGPVPSRRLGRSLGVDLIPYKTCSYDCIYCQLGRTTDRTLERKAYVPVPEVLADLERALTEGPRPDWIGLAGSGEPTLHDGLGELIAGIRRLTDVPVCVITNGSLLWRPDVQADLAQADLVIPSLDVGNARSFRRVNRPHPDLSFEQVVEGLVAFSRDFAGMIWLEVLLIGGITDSTDEVRVIAAMAERMRLDRVQLGTVERPSAAWAARAVSNADLHRLAELFNVPTEVIGASPDPGTTRDRAAGRAEVLALLSRRPCTVQGIATGLAIPPNDVLKHLDVLAAQGDVRTRRRGGAIYYEPVRAVPETGPRTPRSGRVARPGKNTP